MNQKAVIYQLFPRLFGNTKNNNYPGGSIDRNGCGKFNDISPTVLTSMKEFGITHIWLTGVIRHATGTDYSEFGLPPSHPGILKGKAGSPYAICDYYDVDPDLAVKVADRMLEFQSLVERIHEYGLKLIIDFVPNHVSRDYKSRMKPPEVKDLGEDDKPDQAFLPDNNFYFMPGTSLMLNGYQENPAKATGNDVFRPDPSPLDWYETVKLNYGVDYRNGTTFFDPVPDTWKKMQDILRFWAEKGIDGFRCDMAGMVPASFWANSIGKIKLEFPELLFIAELYEPQHYREYLESSGFDFLYDKVGWYDTLRAVITGRANTRGISGIWQSLEGMDDRMLRFLENHDEQRISSFQFAGDGWKGLPGMALAVMMNNGPVLIYNGQEVGEPADPGSGCLCSDGRTSIFEYTFIPEVQKWFNNGRCDGSGLDPKNQDLRRAYQELLGVLRLWPVFSKGCFYDLMWYNEFPPERNRIFAFLRYFPDGSKHAEQCGPGSVLLSAVCFDPSIVKIKIRIPDHALVSMGLGDRERFIIHPVYPEVHLNDSYLTSQLTSTGIIIRFDRAGWSIVSIE